MDTQVSQELCSRKLPDLLTFTDGTAVKERKDWSKRRKEIEQLLQREFCGTYPDFPLTVSGEVVREDNSGFGGKALIQTIMLHVKSSYSYLTFPFQLCLPKRRADAPVFFYFSFTPVIADGLGEEILDNGFGIVNLYYQDVTSDKDDEFASGAGRFYSRNSFDSWGKLAMWAWGMQRIMDYLFKECENGSVKLKSLDLTKSAVMGHSRLGKAALICGTMDERFSLVVSNDSGGGGAALFRKKTGEGIQDLAKHGSRIWFCENFFKNHATPEELPFDQHFLLALTAPRHLYVCSATEDDWADPLSEYLACAAATPAYEILGCKGLITDGKFASPEVPYHEGSIGYHLRTGTHHLGRYDWQQIMEYRRKHNV